MAFDDVLFPMNIAVGMLAGPEREVEVVDSRSGVEARNLASANSRRRYEITVPAAADSTQDTLRHFWEGRRAGLMSFPLLDPADHRSAAPMVAVADTDQVIGTGDAVETDFQLVKVYEAAGPNPYTRKIVHPVTATVVIALDGVPLTMAGNWTVSRTTGIVTFTVAPGAGVVVTAGFKFHTTVRFEGRGLPATFEVGQGTDFEEIDAVASYRGITLIEVLNE